MAFPWVYAEAFEAGTRGQFDSETDVTSILDFPHYSELARFGMAPFEGAYCLRITKLGTGTTSAYVVENTSFDLAASGVLFISFELFLGADLLLADTDRFTIFNLESTLDVTTEVAFGLDRSGINRRFWIAETDASAVTAVIYGTNASMGLNRWYHIEIAVVIDSGAPNDGTITMYVDGANAAAITGLDQAAIVNAKFGMIGPEAGTTGTILLDRIIADDLQVYPPRQRFPLQKTITYSGHVFIGPGAIDGAALLSTTSGNIMRLYDTDTANVNDAQSFVAELDLSAFTSIDDPVTFERGCYVQLTGTNPRGQVLLYKSHQRPGYTFPRYYSDWGYRYYGLRRKVRGQNV